MTAPANVASTSSFLLSRSVKGARASGLFLTLPSRQRRFLSPAPSSTVVMHSRSGGDRAGTSVGAGAVVPAEEAHVEDAVRAVKAGMVIAVPTDTVYGLACDACTEKAVDNIYNIKGRKYTKPLAICVADVTEIPRFASVDHLPKELLDHLLPGPVTVVLSRGGSSALEKSLNPGLDTIGVRVPDSKFIRAIARGLGSALALTSANPSGQLSSVCIDDFKDLWHHCEVVYDGGLLSDGNAGSTIIDIITPGKYKILRAGSAKEETTKILQAFDLKEAL